MAREQKYYPCAIITILCLLFLFTGNGYSLTADQEHLAKGLQYAEEKKWDEGIAEYDKALQINPSYAKAYVCRGLAYSYKELYDQAISSFDKAIAIDPTSDAYNHRGMAYFHKEAYYQALPDFDKAIAINSKNGYAYMFRGYAYYHIGKYQEAWKDVKEAISLNIDVPSFLLTALQEKLGVEQPNNILEGIIVKANSSNKAMVNSQLVSEGDNIGEGKIEKINKDSVDITVNGQKKNIKVGEKCG